ncbi:hypothetical protein GGI13_001265 [Coemansia sp. RSA 455]|nr:hypothetical protein H4S03_001164 [Coemansia sp. S3946]KAJ2051902.1 hypothetical protein H4S04_001692 [Coemansia sp. S16]KAJ2073996.1 hypothetical protein GGH13_001615 [Coemansia sp. S155-1]KAJ2256239.1 hypothetical protein GGI13_001265 [Coemansia sp. RSA 455]KAJ2352284.1 hypothetical protein GGH92_001345 [Coemansia sp. RSA 2673]
MSAVDELAQYLVALLGAQEKSRRIIVAVAGGPGSGKSYISQLVCQAINEKAGDIAVVVPMDGFHLPVSQLLAMEDPEHAMRRRGAPWTFDAKGFVAAVARIRNGSSSSSAVLVPAFDHAAGDPMFDAIAVSPHHRIVLVEGLYAHVNEEPWSQVGQGLADELWWIQPADAAASYERLVQRHIAAGFAPDRKGAEARIASNDALNGAYAEQTRLTATRTVFN